MDKTRSAIAGGCHFTFPIGKTVPRTFFEFPGSDLEQGHVLKYLFLSQEILNSSMIFEPLSIGSYFSREIHEMAT